MTQLSEFAHVADEEAAARRSRATSPGTIYDQLIGSGFTAEQIEAEAAGNRSLGLRRIGLVLAAQEGTSPMVGVTYTGDYRAEEEWGIPQVAVALREGDGAAVDVIDGDEWALALFEHGRRRIVEDHVADRHEVAVRRSIAEGDDYPGCWEDRRLTYAQLREKLTGRVERIPRRKDEALDLYRTVVRGVTGRVSVGEFHDGGVLILLPTTPLLTATLRLLAAGAEHLRMGGSRSPFDAGAVLYDERDLTPESVEHARASEAYGTTQRAKGAPVVEALNQRGRVYAARPGNIAGVDKFFLNYSPLRGKQIFGWFTLAELEEVATAP